MKKYITFMMAALLVCAMMIQMLPLALPVSAEAGTEDYELSNEVPAGLEFTTAASFSKVDNSVRLTCKNNIAWYNYGNYSVFLDPYGNIINGEKLSLVAYVIGELQVAKPVNSSLYAIYYKGVRISQPIYIDCFEQGDCVIAEKEGGRDFYAPDGSRRIPGALPTEYEARSVTSAGTVIARKYNPGIIYSDGTKAYDYALFDQNGRKLFSSAFTGTDESETLYLINDHMISMYGGVKIDNYGVPYGKGSEYVIGGETVFIADAAEENQHEIYDLNHNRLGSIEATGFFRELGDAIIYQLNWRFGLMDKFGNILVEPTYQWAVNADVNDSYYISYQMPALEAVAFERMDYQYDLYNGKGELLGVFADAPIVYPNCIVVNNSDGTTNVYDLNGQLTMACNRGQSFKTVDGVCFLCDGKSSLYYVVDLYGNRLTEEGYTTISEGIADVYGLVHVKRGNTWYTVNAEGTVQNENGMDAKVDLSNPWTKALKPEELLGVYSINGKNGICRYKPPINACEKTEDGKHEWKISEVLKEATCTETGEAVFRCSYCQRTRKESIPIDPENHAWSFTEALTEGDSLHDREGLYTCIRCGATEEDVLCAGKVFTDMPAEGNWAHAPIDWAYFNGITSGKSPTSFAPKDTVTRAEAMTFLWKTLESPEPETTENPFEDVKEGKYYYKPVLWAVENQITSGTSETTFGPKDPCTRAQILTFIWTAAGRPEPETTENPFADVKEGKYYYKAVLWGVENQITSGVAPDQFGANNTCTRAQIVAFLYKAKDLMSRPQTPEPD